MLDAGQNILTRQLPKTGQTTLRFLADDGFYEAGWWRGRLNSNNRIRFIEKTIGGDDIVLDRATGLMWPKDFAGNGANSGNVLIWQAALGFGASLIFAGFDDWRIPNILELLSIAEHEGSSPYLYSNFINCSPLTTLHRWTCTTQPSNIANAYIVYFGYPVSSWLVKTSTSQVIAVRKGI